ncbi:hypothetical protein BDK51DRAFT_28366 [Blyttiomyces helicus]|uniref:Uncharacterized protein n=1 Tax=Blyttiomyces helicus TaxID=388810 RepID=A0A4P9WM95_9FUNG|nr:hypothetical protein BDK51DRAFT_28366 [Blyttiomyces helicus]|eukprot:RKO94191.1 hypothetical protein BDK51DRAFT_28366 [Blyttiomyces helicus]
MFCMVGVSQGWITFGNENILNKFRWRVANNSSVVFVAKALSLTKECPDLSLWLERLTEIVISPLAEVPHCLLAPAEDLPETSMDIAILTGIWHNTIHPNTADVSAFLNWTSRSASSFETLPLDTFMYS